MEITLVPFYELDFNYNTDSIILNSKTRQIIILIWHDNNSEDYKLQFKK